MKSLALQTLKKLQEEFPLPAHIKLEVRCYNKPHLKINNGNNKAFAYVRRSSTSAQIHICLQQPESRIVNSVAHEYYHCIQKYIKGEPDRHPMLEPDAIAFAKPYSAAHIKQQYPNIDFDKAERNLQNAKG